MSLIRDTETDVEWGRNSSIVSPQLKQRSPYLITGNLKIIKTRILSLEQNIYMNVLDYAATVVGESLVEVIFNGPWRSVTFCCVERAKSDISFQIRTRSACVWTSPPWREINEHNSAGKRLSIPQTVCSRMPPTLQHDLDCFKEKNQEGTTEEQPETHTYKCHIQGTNIHRTHIDEPSIIYI